MRAAMSFKPVTSRQNPNFKRWMSLQDSKGMKKTSTALVMGRKIVPELLESRRPLVREIIVSDKRMGAPLATGDIPVFEVTNEMFRDLDQLGTQSPVLVMGIPELEVTDLSTPPEDGLQLLSPLSDPRNLGAVLRSAEAFECSSVVLLNEACHPFHPLVTKTSSGSNWRIPLKKGPSLKDLPDPEQAAIFGLQKNGEAIHQFRWPEKIRLLIGEEGQGLPEGFPASRALSIPISSSVESLNAVTAASIALYLHTVR